MDGAKFLIAATMFCLLGTTPTLADESAQHPGQGLQFNPVRVVPLVETPALTEDRPDGFNVSAVRVVAPDSLSPENAVTLSPAPSIDVFAGYRFPESDVASHDVRVDTEFDGPYVGASFRF